MDKNEIKNFIARRVAHELHDGDVVWQYPLDPPIRRREFKGLED